MTDDEIRKALDLADRDIMAAIAAARRARACLADGQAHDAVTALMVARLQLQDARDRLIGLESRAIDAHWLAQLCARSAEELDAARRA